MGANNVVVTEKDYKGYQLDSFLWDNRLSLREVDRGEAFKRYYQLGETDPLPDIDFPRRVYVTDMATAAKIKNTQSAVDILNLEISGARPDRVVDIEVKEKVLAMEGHIAGSTDPDAKQIVFKASDTGMLGKVEGTEDIVNP